MTASPSPKSAELEKLSAEKSSNDLDTNDWIVVYREKFNDSLTLRIGYQYAISGCHACTTRVRAQLVRANIDSVVQTTPLSVGTSWGRSTKKFKTHMVNGVRLLSYQHHYGNNGNNTEYLYFFKLDSLSPQPIAVYSLPTACDHGVAVKELPNSVLEEFMDCAPAMIKSVEYVYQGCHFDPHWDITPEGLIKFSYTQSSRGFEPLSGNCRENMNYTFPPHSLTVSGPLSPSPGIIVRTNLNGENKTPYSLSPLEGCKHMTEVLTNNISVKRR